MCQSTVPEYEKGRKQPMASKYDVSQIENEISGLQAGFLLTGYCIPVCDLPIRALGMDVFNQ